MVVVSLVGAICVSITLVAGIFYVMDARHSRRVDERLISVTDYHLVRVQTEEARESFTYAKVNAEALLVGDERGFSLAQEIIKEIKRRASALEDRREEYMKPLRQLLKLVRDDTAPVLLAAEEIERILKAKCLAYRSDVTRIHAEAEARARALVAGQAPVAEQRAALVEVAEAIAPKSAGVSYRDNWQARVIDQSKVPEFFWLRVISQEMIDAEVRSQVGQAQRAGRPPWPEIPGVEIVNRVIMSVRKDG